MKKSERRAEELEKLTVPQLKLICAIPKSIKKKTDIIDFVLKHESSKSEESPKRIKIAPVFAMSKSAAIEIIDHPACTLCDDSCTVWCELGLALCPVCRSPSSPTLFVSAVKQEAGVTNLRFTLNEHGRIVLDLAHIDKEALKDLVALYGYGLCESAEALVSHASLEKAAEFLLNKHRSSAENSSIAEAQLNSEQTKDQVNLANIQKEGKARSAVTSDLSVLTEIDAGFSAEYIFPTLTTNSGNRLLGWLAKSPDNALLVFDYLVLRRDSVKWYKNHALHFFDSSEAVLHSLASNSVSQWFQDEIEKLRNALFTLPESAGSIPAIFRNQQEVDLSISDDIQFVPSEISSSTVATDIVTLD